MGGGEGEGGGGEGGGGGYGEGGGGTGGGEGEGGGAEGGGGGGDGDLRCHPAARHSRARQLLGIASTRADSDRRPVDGLDDAQRSPANEK